MGLNILGPTFATIASNEDQKFHSEDHFNSCYIETVSVMADSGEKITNNDELNIWNYKIHYHLQGCSS